MTVSELRTLLESQPDDLDVVFATPPLHPLGRLRLAISGWALVNVGPITNWLLLYVGTEPPKDIL